MITRRATSLVLGLVLAVGSAGCAGAPSPRVSTGVTHPAPAAASARAAAPVIVIDPGHSRPIRAIDPRTQLNVSDYANQPEMRDVFAVATLLAAKLRKAGYRVVMTKAWAGQRRTLAQRAAIANRAGAALAISIHDQAGANGGIVYRRGNNIVYSQQVGAYRVNRFGKRIVFRDSHVAWLSLRYAKKFVAQRSWIQNTSVRLQRNVGYDLGSRGLSGGNMWMVQLLSKVPWIYNEAGGNSLGRIGLNARDRANYAEGLYRGVRQSIPLR
ncbi:N-acetylmuramoyl-L-alanine amidase [Jatrophihabitans fulvus]